MITKHQEIAAALRSLQRHVNDAWAETIRGHAFSPEALAELGQLTENFTVAWMQFKIDHMKRTPCQTE